ncbi:hypothetical protein QBC38DRAFT_441226 [Podospora fimiseda]|uniref:Uncharacterized protein n=1 Tax=Podospora fimiseda TaxID=252190 RepID=A0AAN7BUZ2_9PEZI|nr:hypothetical protein QBC38DRAFT_441226 [Podospora fimiseda]
MAESRYIPNNFSLAEKHPRKDKTPVSKYPTSSDRHVVHHRAEGEKENRENRKAVSDGITHCLLFSGIPSNRTNKLITPRKSSSCEKGNPEKGKSVHTKWQHEEPNWLMSCVVLVRTGACRPSIIRRRQSRRAETWMEPRSDVLLPKEYLRDKKETGIIIAFAHCCLSQPAVPPDGTSGLRSSVMPDPNYGSWSKNPPERNKWQSSTLMKNSCK